MAVDMRKFQDCRFFLLPAGCQKGDACPFLHDEGKRAAVLAATARATSEKDCYWFSLGQCKKGDACPFRHDPSKVVGPGDNPKLNQALGQGPAQRPPPAEDPSLMVQLDSPARPRQLAAGAQPFRPAPAAQRPPAAAAYQTADQRPLSRGRPAATARLRDVDSDSGYHSGGGAGDGRAAGGNFDQMKGLEQHQLPPGVWGGRPRQEPQRLQPGPIRRGPPPIDDWQEERVPGGVSRRPAQPFEPEIVASRSVVEPSPAKRNRPSVFSRMSGLKTSGAREEAPARPKRQMSAAEDSLPRRSARRTSSGSAGPEDRDQVAAKRPRVDADSSQQVQQRQQQAELRPRNASASSAQRLNTALPDSSARRNGTASTAAAQPVTLRMAKALQSGNQAQRSASDPDKPVFKPPKSREELKKERERAAKGQSLSSTAEQSAPAPQPAAGAAAMSSAAQPAASSLPQGKKRTPISFAKQTPAAAQAAPAPKPAASTSAAQPAVVASAASEPAAAPSKQAEPAAKPAQSAAAAKAVTPKAAGAVGRNLGTTSGEFKWDVEGIDDIEDDLEADLDDDDPDLEASRPDAKATVDFEDELAEFENAFD